MLRRFTFLLYASLVAAFYSILSLSEGLGPESGMFATMGLIAIGIQIELGKIQARLPGTLRTPRQRTVSRN